MAWSRAMGAAACGGGVGGGLGALEAITSSASLLGRGCGGALLAPCPWVPRAWGAGKGVPLGGPEIHSGRLSSKAGLKTGLSDSKRQFSAHQAQLPGTSFSTWDGPVTSLSSSEAVAQSPGPGLTEASFAHRTGEGGSHWALPPCLTPAPYRPSPHTAAGAFLKPNASPPRLEPCSGFPSL